MTYCIGARLNTGLVFLSDSRTNAGVDQVSTVRKMTLYEMPDERVMVLLTAGNLAISQAVKQELSRGKDNQQNLWNVATMVQAAELVGQAVRAVYERDHKALENFGVDFNVSIIFGGQIKGERPRLFNVYSAGNFIEAHDESCYFQIGESKYGKPILDRVLSPNTALDEAAKCALISMDSTLKSNISVGLPLDLLVYDRDALRVNRFARIDEKNQYFQMIRSSWGQRLKQVFAEISEPTWGDAGSMNTEGLLAKPVRATPPNATPEGWLDAGTTPMQSLASGEAVRQSDNAPHKQHS